jgi:DNA mismatch repair ATPase MutS
MLVTGSNMSGKSTLLRAVGLLQVLAQAGAPVCARRAQLPQLVLRTVVRVDDSLARGMSHFYAELERLKEVVAAAGQSGTPLLYLLDEILHGTNTRERELGARLVIRTLCQRAAMGIVTTHDLSLTSLEAESAGAVHNFHFTEIVEAGAMRFDYQLRLGPVRSSNALRLMRQVGIDLDWSLADGDGAPSTEGKDVL